MIAAPVRPHAFTTIPRVNLARSSAAPATQRAAPSFPLLGGLAAAAIGIPSRRTQRAAEIVDVEVVQPVKPMDTPEVKAAFQVVEAALSHALSTGVPVRNQVMEYKADPLRSPLANCGIPALAPAGKKATELLIQGLAAKVDQDSAEVAAAVLCLMPLALQRQFSAPLKLSCQHLNELYNWVPCSAAAFKLYSHKS